MTKWTSGGKIDCVWSFTGTAGFAHQRNVWGQRRPVVELASDLNVCFVRIESKCGDPLCPVHLIHIVDEKGPAAVLILPDQMVHRHERSRPVVLRPVEFDAARDPWSQQPDQSRLDHVVVIYEVIAVGLVISPLDPSAEFRKNHHLYIIILKKDRVICSVCFHAADLFRGRVRIHFSAAALIDSFSPETSDSYPALRLHRSGSLPLLPIFLLHSSSSSFP